MYTVYTFAWAECRLCYPIVFDSFDKRPCYQAVIGMASRNNRDDDDDDDDVGAKGAGFVAAQRRKSESALKGKQLRAELDELLRAEKDREAIASGKASSGAPAQYKLYQTLFEYKSEDPDDLTFDAGEILR